MRHLARRHRGLEFERVAFDAVRFHHDGLERPPAGVWRMAAAARERDATLGAADALLQMRIVRALEMRVHDAPDIVVAGASPQTELEVRVRAGEIGRVGELRVRNTPLEIAVAGGTQPD